MFFVDVTKKMFTTNAFSKLKTLIADILCEMDPNRGFVVCDIDDTVLYPDQKGAAHPHGMFIHDTAVNLGIPVYFVTARVDSPSARAFAIRQLENLGIKSPMIIMRPANVTTWVGISQYKEASRRNLEHFSGRLCKMNVGDQWTDLMPMQSIGTRDFMNNLFSGENVMYKGDDGSWSVKLAV